jgi:hypothetical protein
MPNHATGSDVEAVTFEDEDHFAVAAAQRAFIEVYEYLKGEEPQYTTVQCGEDPITVEGISESFADNVPIGGKLEIREVGDTPRDMGEPDMTINGSADGHFGPIELKRGVPYEFRGYDDAGNLIGSQYFSPFLRSSRLVRLLVPSSNALIADASTNMIVRGPNHMALVARWAGGAFRKDLGASLKIDGEEILTEENAGAAALATDNLRGGVVGFFMYDADENGATDLGLVASAPFLSFTDVFMDAKTAKFIEVTFTAGSEDPTVVDQKVRVPTWPSSDALNLVMFQ